MTLKAIANAWIAAGVTLLFVALVTMALRDAVPMPTCDEIRAIYRLPEAERIERLGELPRAAASRIVGCDR